MDGITKEQKATLTKLLRNCGSTNRQEAVEAQEIFVQAIENPVRQGIVDGDTVTGLYEVDDLTDRQGQAKYPVDFYRIDNANDFTAYVCPSLGELPTRSVSGDYVVVPTYDTGGGIEIPLKYIRDAHWNVIERAMEVMQAGFVQKRNNDGWHTILAGAVDRNIIVNDASATAGQFTKRLISLMKVVMRRNGGGNSTSINRRLLTHLYLSPEGIEDIRNWDSTIVDQITQRELYVNEGAVNRIFGVNLVDLDELGEGQDYQNYYTQILGASLAASDVELVVGLNLANHSSFIRPIIENLVIKNDPTAEKNGLMSFYGREEAGFGLLDSGNVLVGSF